MSSIRNRLTLLIIAGMTLLMIIAGVTIDYLLRAQLRAEFDRNLLSKTMSLVTLSEQEDGEVEFDFIDGFMPEYSAEERPEYFQLWLTDGTLIARSESLDEADLPRSDLPLDSHRFSDLTLPDGRAGRLVAVRFIPYDEDAEEDDEDDDEDERRQAETALAGDRDAESPDSRVRADIAVARGTEDLDQLVATVRAGLAAAFVVLMGAAALLIRMLVGHGLKPLNRIAAEVRGLDADRLNNRLAETPGSDELAPITHQLNALLDRLEAAFQREKRFSGNVAHELRTPIAELRSLAEVGGEWPADQELVADFFGQLVHLADDMERTITNLMILSRLEAGTQQAEMSPIKLSRLIEDTWKRLASQANGKRVLLDNRVRGDLLVRSDADKLGLILTNLFSNAVSYSPDESAVVVEVEEGAGGSRLAVSNPTLDLDEQDLPLMFERFWRKDTARTGGRHAGLGLSLVEALAELLSIKVSSVLDNSRRFTITLSELQAV